MEGVREAVGNGGGDGRVGVEGVTEAVRWGQWM